MLVQIGKDQERKGGIKKGGGPFDCCRTAAVCKTGMGNMMCRRRITAHNLTNCIVPLQHIDKDLNGVARMRTASDKRN